MKKSLIHTLAILIAIVVFHTDSASAQIAPTNIEVTASTKQSSVGRIGVTLSKVELEDAFQRQSKSRGLNPAVFREELVGALKELHPGTIRMEFPDMGQQLAGELSISGAAMNGGSVSSSRYGLGEFLQLCVEAGSDPWIRIPSGTTPEQMRELVQYLSGTGSDALTAARVAGGQSDPWTQLFGKIHLELSNESGSVAAASEYMEAAAYADRANADFGAAREVAGFEDSKFDLMLSGTGVSAQWAAAVLAQSHEQNSVAITADLPWRAAGAQQSELFGVLLAEPESMDSTGGILSREVTRLAMTTSASASVTSVNVARSQLNLAAGGSEQLAQSWGASLAQAEHLLQMMAMGVRYQNGAVLTESNLRCVSGSQMANCRGAQLLTSALANGAIGGTMLQTLQTGANPSWSQVVSGEQLHAHALQSFAFTEGGKVSLVLFNLSRTSELPLTLSGANAPAGDVQMAQIAPREITASNESGAELQPSTQTLSASDVNGELSLPPFSMTILSWEAGSGARTATSAVSARAELTSATAKLTNDNALTAATPSAAQAATTSAPVINCPSGFASSGTCGVAMIGGGGQALAIVGSANGSNPGLSGSQIDLIPSGGVHTGLAVDYQTAVNVQAFSSTFTFVPNGWNIAFVLQNNTISSGNGPNSKVFAAGAGCEGGFYQAFNGPPPNNIFALMLDQQGYLSSTPTFTYSSVQIYKAGQSPCNPNDNQPNYYLTNKISTSPVPLNSPASSQGTITGHTYSVTIKYDGTNLVMSMFDLTGGGSCPGASCFTQTWNNVNIPALVGGNTAYLGLTGGTNEASSHPLLISSLVYTVGANTPNPAATPTFSPAAGTYTAAQAVSINDATSGAAIYYTTDGTTPTTSSTKYSGPVTVGSTETLKAIAAATGDANSSVATAAYTISATTTPAAPTFSPAGGSYTSSQTVTISDSTAGATIYYTTNGTTPTTSSTVYSGPIMVSATETVQAMAVSAAKTASLKANAATTGTSSLVASAAYTINSVLPTPTFSLAAGTYTTAQSVTISDSTAGTTIYYTTNGSTPTTSSTKYTGAITVSATETLQAIAVETGHTNSSTATAKYTISGATTTNPTGATTYINYPSGAFKATSFALNGGATVTSAGLLQLTDGGGNESRSSWFSTPVPVQNFTTDFTFQQLKAGADGMTFTIQGQGATALGSYGSGLGYQSISRSVAVKFDLYSNSGEGTDSTGLYTNGAIPTLPAFDLTSTGIKLTGGNVMHAHLVYDGTNLTMTLTDTVTNATATEAVQVNIPSLVGGNTAYVGFTGGTGGATSTQNVLSWTYVVPAAQTTGGTTPINYPSGAFKATSFALNGGATVTSAGLLQLTDGGGNESRSSWFSTPVPVQNFTTDFTFQQLKAGADGMTFTIQGQGATALGSYGSGLGYQSISRSVAVKFDLYSNSGEGTDSTGLYTNGAIPTLPAVDMTSTGIKLTGGNVMHAHLVYDGTNLTMTLTDMVTNATATEVFPVNIPSLVGGNTAYVGFTGGTGGATSTQNVLSWTYVVPAAKIAATPTFSVAAGTYAAAQSVAISDATAGATIYYTTNGTAPTTASTKYASAVAVTATETLKAIAIASGYANSATASAAYTINISSTKSQTPTATPSFSVAAGTYTAAQSVAISDATAGATIYYTTNGTTPTTSSTVYAGTISVKSTETLSAIAVATAHSVSAVASAVYQINTNQPATPVISLRSGTYSSQQSVIVSDATPGVTLTYTLNGETPTSKSTQYTMPLAIKTTSTLQVIAIAPGGKASNIASATYTMAAVAPTFNPPSGTYPGPLKVTINSATPTAQIAYTPNGNLPSQLLTYTGAITLTASGKVYALATETGYTQSATVVATYTIEAAAAKPVFSRTAGTYASAQSVSITDATAGATIYYTTNGSTPTTSSTKYTGAITVSATKTLEAIAVANGFSNSAVATAAYTINSSVATLATPVFSPTAGTHSALHTVSISDATASAKIYIASNGTTPTTSSSVYSDPISASETLKAIAIKTGYTPSISAKAAYTIPTGLPASSSISLLNPAPLRIQSS